MKDRQIKRTVYLTPDQLKKLKALSDHTRVPQAVYYREAIDDLLEKYRTQLEEITVTSKKKK